MPSRRPRSRPRPTPPPASARDARPGLAAPIAVDEYRQRRDAVLKALDGAAALVLAGEPSNPDAPRRRVDANFFYLTGVADEPHAALLFDPSAEDERRRCVLFLRPLNPEADRWEGYRESVSQALRDRLGFGAVMRTGQLPAMLLAAARRTRRLACLHPLANHEQPVSPDLATFRKVAERVPECRLLDRTDVLRALRAVKSSAEVALMRRAIDATARGFDAAARALAPGVGEASVHRALERAFVDAGAEGTAYSSIVGSGVHATVLHYTANDGPTRAGDLVVIDAGARLAGYCADITRTYPVSGRFDAAQRSLYELVLRAQEAAIAAVRPGATMTAVGRAARDIIDDAGLGDAYLHGVGHHLGLDVHDLDPDAPLAPGMVVTIEPGIYLPDQARRAGVGIRIEDDVLVTARGREVLSEAIPKAPRDVESLMAR